MAVSQHDIQCAALLFEPPLTTSAQRRNIYLFTSSGILLAGITYSKKNGLLIPPTLSVTNRPESREGSSALQQSISELTREVLIGRVVEQLHGRAPECQDQVRRRTE